jgi:hypothetical protein
VTATRPADSAMNHFARRQHANAADKLAQRVASCAHAVRLDLAHGRPAQAAARQLLADAIALVEKLAELREAEKWTRQPAA